MATVVDSGLFKADERKSRVEVVIDTFKSLLLSKQLQPGDRLPNEFDLTKSLSTSRGSVREAMKILASFGVVQIRPGDGTYVSRSVGKNLFDHLLFQLLLSDTDRRQLMELRELIELGVLKAIIANATEEDLQEIERRHVAMDTAVKNHEADAKVLTSLDKAFHVALGEASRNPLIQRIYEFTLELFTPSIEQTHKQLDNGKVAVGLHGKLLEALRGRNLPGSVAAVEESIRLWMIRSE